MARYSVFFVLACFAITVVACSTASKGGVAPVDAGVDAAVSYGTSACGGCVKHSCSGEVGDCGGDPDCAQYLSCLYACPLTATGDADADCEKNCPRGTSSAAAQALGKLTACRATGGGAACAECGQVSGGTGLLHQTCMASTETKPCFICEDQKCCDSYAKCHANAECDAMKVCLQMCPKGMSCDLDCYNQHPLGMVDWAPLSTCMLLLCAAPCLTPPAMVDPCIKCIASNCADAYADLGSTTAGYLAQKCIAVCATGDATCINGCKTKYPSAVKPLEALLACSLEKCKTTC